jgi:hypothetical protein
MMAIIFIKLKKMKNQFVKYLLSAGLIMIFSGIYSNVFSQNTSGPVKLVYNYPADKAIKYSATSTMAMIMDIQGQSMQTDIASAFGCTVKSAGNQDNNLKLEILIDTLGQTTNSPMGGSGGAAQGIKGKTFSIVISPEGKVVDISGATVFVYNLEGSGESNMSQTFSDFFPVLPSKAIATGDTWNSTDSMITKSPYMTMKTIDNTVNKFEGFETIDGIECAKISTQHSGTITMNVQSQGNDLSIRGPYTGTSEYLFAVREGYFIKMTSATKVNGNMDMTSPQEMSFPIVLDMKSVNEVKK